MRGVRRAAPSTQVVEADQARHVEHAVVHLAALGPPRDAIVDSSSKSVRRHARSDSQPGADVDPRAVAQVAPLGVVEERP